MNFKQQLLNALQEDKVFRQEVVLLLGEELEMFSNMDSYKHKIELPELDTEFIESVDLSFQTSVSDDIRIDAMKEDVRILINKAFSSIWNSALSRQKSKEIQTRNSFKELAYLHIDLKGEIEALNYIDSVKNTLDDIVEYFNMVLIEKKSEMKIIDIINNIDDKTLSEFNPFREF